MASAKVQKWISDVKALTATVTTNGQAVALARRAMADGRAAADRFGGFFDGIQGQVLAWVANVADHLRDVESGDPAALVGRSWVTLKGSIHGLYIGIWSVVDTFPEGSSAWQDAAIIAGLFATGVTESAALAVKKTLGVAADDVLFPLVKSLWPLLLGVAVVGGIALLVAARAGKAVPV